MNKQIALSEVDHFLQRAKDANDQMINAQIGRDFRNSWEDFLINFQRSIGRLISFGMGDKRSRGWAHRLKRASTSDDEGLVYLRKARNCLEHGLVPSAHVTDPFVSLGGFAALRGTHEQRFEDNFVNGKNTGRFTISVDENGRVTKLEGEVNADVIELPGKIALATIRPDDEKKAYAPPKSVWGDALHQGSAEDISLKSLVGIDQARCEFRHLILS